MSVHLSAMYQGGPLDGLREMALVSEIYRLNLVKSGQKCREIYMGT